MSGGTDVASRSSAGVPSPAVWLRRVLRWFVDRYETVTTRLIAARGLAVLRVGYGTLFVLFLAREWGERGATWGPGSAWSPAIDRAYAAGSGWPAPLRAWFTTVAGLTRTEFDLFYLAAMVIGVAFALGWHTRIVSVFFAVVVVALENRAPLLTDGGDNVLTLMSIYLAFTACGAHWSLDARRRKIRQEAGQGGEGEAAKGEERAAAGWRAELREARRRMAIVMHNGAVLVVAAQICVVYGTAGFLKVQGSMWQDGSALAYVLRLNWFHPWPALSAWLAGHALAIAIAGYVTVFAQAGFPFIVFSPRLKYPALAVLVAMHLGIAVLLGLPFFSAIMLVGDAIFLPDRFWAAAGRALRGPAYAQSMSAAKDANAAQGASAASREQERKLGHDGDGDRDAGRVPAARRAVPIRPTLVFDGDCGFCTASVHVLERWCRPAVRFVPWQALDLAAHGLTEQQVSTAVQWLPVSASTPIRSGAAAVAQVLLRSRLPWRPVGALMLVPPISWLAAGAYHVISANRYRLPGSTPACAVDAPRREERDEAAPSNGRQPIVPGGQPGEQPGQHLGADSGIQSGDQPAEYSGVRSGDQSAESESAQRLGDLSGGAHDAGPGSGWIELAERDHAD